jgi:hypothetical protein
MNMKDADMSAYPIIGATLDGNEGLTKREHLAGLAMQGLCHATNSAGEWAHDADTVAIVAAKYADALLTELNKGE